MRLKINNVGRIKWADVEMDGITVICGDNDTGKSTVGKLLYCIYASLYSLPDSIYQERLSSLMSTYNTQRFHRPLDLAKAESIFRELLDDASPTKDTIMETVNNLLHDEDESFKEPVGTIVKRMERYLAVTDREIVTAFLQRNIKREFGGKLANVNVTPQKADVSLDMKEGSISFHTNGENQKVMLDHWLSLDKRLIYIDDPFILDEVGRPMYQRFSNEHHRYALLNLIQRAVETEAGNVVEEIARDARLHEITETMRNISDGTLVFEDGELKYRHTGLKENLSLVSVSTGIKTFAILRVLLERGYIEENGVIVMDEPEVHLHPEWQIRLAEITVLLQKSLDLNIVITTHSVEFLTAIEFFSKKHGVQEKCRFYLTEIEEAAIPGDLARVVFRNTTKDMEKIYSSISEPYLKIYEQMEGD